MACMGTVFLYLVMQCVKKIGSCFYLFLFCFVSFVYLYFSRDLAVAMFGVIESSIIYIVDVTTI